MFLINRNSGTTWPFATIVAVVSQATLTTSFLVIEWSEWYKKLCVEGELYGYIVNGSKSWLIVKSEKDAARAKEIFGDLVNINNNNQFIFIIFFNFYNRGSETPGSSFRVKGFLRHLLFKESGKLDKSDESPDRDRQDSASVSIRWLHKRIRIQVHLLLKDNRGL